MIFAVLVLEREPLQWSEFPAALVSWAQTAGTVAAIGLAIWLLAVVGLPELAALLGTRRPAARDKPWTSEGRAFAVGVGITAGLYALALLALLAQAVGILGADEAPPPLSLTAPPPPPLFDNPAELFVTLASLAALITAALPLLTSLFGGRLSGRRIWAIARLSLKEARHSRVVLIFSMMAIVFLFADWFVQFKPEDQLRNYVRAIYWTMPFLFFMTAIILGSFTIPNDLRRQSIHTIVTKPVERFEIFLGRFLGFAVLMTAGMVILSGLSLIYVVRGVGEAAAEESYKARMPVYGMLSFAGTRNPALGDNVGRVWDYRSYIGGRDPRNPNQPQQFAVWAFGHVPSLANDQESVRVEFTFDIFRLSKGQKEQPGVPCTFLFVDGRLSVADVEAIVDKQFKSREGELVAANKTRDEIDAILIKDLGMFVRGGFRVIDYHTQSIDVPVAFFKKLAETNRGGDGKPAFKVLVEVDEDRITAQTQMLGVARRDLYLLPAERAFWQNFLKGMLGMWMLMLLVLGIAIALSAYLSGVITLLLTLFLFLMGANRDFIYQIATGRAEGGGPLEAAIRLGHGRPIATPLEPGAGYDVVKGVDEGFRLALRLVRNVFPDVDRFDLHEYVASGFDISWTQVLLLDNFLWLVGYLIPCFILAYYLLRFREVANPG